MNRRPCLEFLAESLDEHALTVTSLSSNSAIWGGLRGPGGPNFYALNMGLCLPFALGLSLAFPRRQVIALESDGSLLLDTSTLVTVADVSPPKLLCIVFDNGAYARMGPTASARRADLAQMAAGAGIPITGTVRDEEAFQRAVREALASPGPAFLVAKVEAETERLPRDNRRQSGRVMKDAFVEAVLRHPDYGAWRDTPAP
jgi:thiamine pyrophosphate-dependent acetolactate synthase large subunit-like protein